MNNRILKEIKEKTGIETGWKEMNGPTTGVGVEYWFINKNGTEVYVSDDQGCITVSEIDN